VNDSIHLRATARFTEVVKLAGRDAAGRWLQADGPAAAGAVCSVNAIGHVEQSLANAASIADGWTLVAARDASGFRRPGKQSRRMLTATRIDRAGNAIRGARIGTRNRDLSYPCLRQGRLPI
jgi:hypothetical protein